MSSHQHIVDFIKTRFPGKDFIPLHEPMFHGKEKKYLVDCIDSTFVSSVGKFVDQFEEQMTHFTGAKYAVATVNGTAALHIALLLAGVESNHEVITQALTFVATGNAISYTGAKPIFLDVDKNTLGMCPKGLKGFLENNADLQNNKCYNKTTGKRISACVPMHTFGHACMIEEILDICNQYGITVVEDAAESLGTFYNDRHTGTFGQIGTFSFNGNKTITTGGGGMIVTNNDELAKLAKHLTTTAKVPHKWDYVHDRVGFNYRLPNINAALGCAQLEKLPLLLKKKRALAKAYSIFFEETGVEFLKEPKHSRSNYWLNAILLENKNDRDRFLELSNANGVMTRPVWRLMHLLPMYQDCQTDCLENSLFLTDRLVNIPSSASA